GQTRNRNTVWRATHVIETHRLKITDTGRIPPVFPTNSQLNVRPGPTSQLNRHFDQFANTFLIDRSKRIGFKNSFADIRGQKSAGVVARNPQSRLGQIIGAEAEKLSMISQLIR